MSHVVHTAFCNTTSNVKSIETRAYVRFRPPCSKLSGSRTTTQLSTTVFGFYLQNAWQLEFDQVKLWFGSDKWMKSTLIHGSVNCLIAVCAWPELYEAKAKILEYSRERKSLEQDLCLFDISVLPTVCGWHALVHLRKINRRSPSLLVRREYHGLDAHLKNPRLVHSHALCSLGFTVVPLLCTTQNVMF